MSAFDNLRIGQGFDVHPFKEGRDLWIGGVKIPSDRGLDGHSDADVLIHAVVDAILGALGEGDIGTHFPPTEARWKNCASSEFLKAAAKMIQSHSAKLISVDCTLLLEAPKVKPYYSAMRHRLAELLEVRSERVSVKATTTEGLGFIGRNEGAAAQAVCLIELKVK